MAKKRKKIKNIIIKLSPVKGSIIPDPAAILSTIIHPWNIKSSDPEFSI